MTPIAVLILTALSAYGGFKDASPMYIAALATAFAFYIVAISGRRAPPPDTGLIMSILWVLIFSASVCAISYFVGNIIGRFVS
jgi:hypothetical protein